MTWALDLARRRQAAEDSPPLFGVILYTDAHPNVKKVLRDEDYWTALDEISSASWAVFSVRAWAGEWGFPRMPPDVIGMLTQVWKEPKANRELLSTFELEDTKDLPAIVVFVLEGDELHRTVIPLDETTTDTAFTSLKLAFLDVSAALRTLDEQALHDSSSVFDAVNRKLRGQRNRRKIRDAYRVLKELRDWLPF
jgi:hypothetical protein